MQQCKDCVYLEYTGVNNEAGVMKSMTAMCSNLTRHKYSAPISRDPEVEACLYFMRRGPDSRRSWTFEKTVMELTGHVRK